MWHTAIEHPTDDANVIIVVGDKVYDSDYIEPINSYNICDYGLFPASVIDGWAYASDVVADCKQHV